MKKKKPLANRRELAWKSDAANALLVLLVALVFTAFGLYELYYPPHQSFRDGIWTRMLRAFFGPKGAAIPSFAFAGCLYYFAIRLVFRRIGDSQDSDTARTTVASPKKPPKK